MTNDREYFSFNNEDTAWYVCSIYISQIIGSFLNGCNYKVVGRRSMLLFMNALMIIAWVMLGFSWSKDILIAATIILGISIGYLEGTVLDYISQISQPQLRKGLALFTDVFRAFGTFLVSSLGLITTWRIAAAFGVFLNVFVVIVLYWIPETPEILNTGGNSGRADKILRWLLSLPQLRQREVSFSAELNNTSGNDVMLSLKSQDGGMVLLQQIKLLKDSKMQKSLGLVAMLLFISNFNGAVASQPYVYMLSKDYGMPMNDSISAFVFNAVAFVSSVLSMVTTHRYKQKSLMLCSITLATISTGMLFLTSSWIAYCSYCMLVFATSYGLEGNMWSVLDDLFFQEGRTLAFRIATALDCFYNLMAVSFYAPLRRLVGIQYLFLLFMFFNICGFFIIYFFMPETEENPVEETGSNEKQKEDDMKKS